jgi:pyruvate/2-oxoglutarate dehydrogenase complex dihydrolipoamide acyltransferase (E2) component
MREMTTEIKLPKLGFAVNDGVIAEWLLADGMQVVEGQPLYSLENDKAVTEMEAPASGRLKILVSPGTRCEVGTVLGIIE